MEPLRAAPALQVVMPGERWRCGRQAEGQHGTVCSVRMLRVICCAVLRKGPSE